jgi:hypothetical protein
MKRLFRSRLLPGTVLLLLVAVSVYGCSDFLNGAAQGALDAQTLANKAGVEGSLISAYRMMDCNYPVSGNWGCAASDWVWGSVTSDDAYKGSEASDQPGATDIELYSWATGAADDYLNQKWLGSYEGIVRANATLRLLDTIVANKPDELNQAEQDGIRGEALFLRAHFHFEAWQMWGHIPYYSENTTDFRTTNVGVSAPDSILADLDRAIALLPETPRNGELGRATKWTAEAYKGRVQVYNGDYAAGATTLRDVRDNGPYALQPNYSQVWTGYDQYSNGPETILAFQASANDGNPDGENANYGERLNFPHSGSPFGCCGFHQPSQYLVNYFQVDPATGLPLALTNPNWNARDANLDAAASATMALDPRLDWTVGRDGVPYKDWGPHAAGWIRAPGYGGPYSPKKSSYEKASGAMSNVGWTNTQLSSMNIHIFRYADALLLLAEADVESGGSLQEACTIVNEIRTRAAAGAQGPGTSAADMVVPINDASITWAQYQVGLYPCPFADQAYGRNAVRAERMLELAMEGHRFFDLKRWGIADQVLNAYIQTEQNRRPYLAAAAAFTSRYNLFPIPTIQVELSKVNGQAMVQQNEGW